MENSGNTASTRQEIWALPLLLLALATTVSVGASTVLLGVVLATALTRAVMQPEARTAVPRAVGVALLAVLVWHTVACFTGTPTRPQKLIDEWWIDLLIVVVPVLGFGHPRAIARIVMAMMGLGAVVAIYGTVQHWTGIDFIRGEPTNQIAPGRHLAYGFFGHHLTYGGHVLVLWTLALASVLQRPRENKWAWGALLLTSSGLLFTFARSAHLGAITAATVLVFTLPLRRRLVAVGAGIVAGAIALLLPVLRTRLLAGFDLSSEPTRLNLWRSSWQGILDRPVLGWGPGNFDRMMASHEVEGFYDSRAHAHNDWLMHAVDAGWPGLLLSVALSLTLAWILWTRRHRAGIHAWIPAAGAALQAAFAIAGLFQVYQTDDEVEFALLLTVGAGLALIGRKRASLDEA